MTVAATFVGLLCHSTVHPHISCAEKQKTSTTCACTAATLLTSLAPFHIIESDTHAFLTAGYLVEGELA